VLLVAETGIVTLSATHWTADGAFAMSDRDVTRETMRTLERLCAPHLWPPLTAGSRAGGGAPGRGRLAVSSLGKMRGPVFEGVTPFFKGGPDVEFKAVSLRPL